MDAFLRRKSSSLWKLEKCAEEIAERALRHWQASSISSRLSDQHLILRLSLSAYDSVMTISRSSLYEASETTSLIPGDFEAVCQSVMDHHPFQLELLV